MSTNVMFNICLQRQNSQLTHIPFTRLELQPSPYDISLNGTRLYTKRQLDMRRKVEILKYNPSTQSTQTNAITKAQKFIQVVKGSVKPLSQTTIASITNDGVPPCQQDQYIPTPTSSCNVPGPIILLYEEENVPLYNYIKNPNAYAIIEDDNLQPDK